jgi:phenylacetate-CoA ligase
MACGDRLTGEGLERVRAYARRVAAEDPLAYRGDMLPPWLREFAAFCLREVPIYRLQGGDPDRFAAIPTIGRADIAREPWSFVPDSIPLDDLIVYYSSGATGSPMDVLSHPETASMRLPLFEKALGKVGVTLEGGASRVSIVFVCSQKTTVTYASLVSYLGGAGHVKINLNPTDWRDPEDRVRFLDRCDPEIYSGDPLSLLDLASLPLTTHPKALISSAMTLLPGVRRQLETRFGCPVVDLYSTCESGPIGIATARGIRILPPDLYVEVLRPNGEPCREGERGEVALSGGRNRFLPMLRYRIGDYAAIRYEPEGPILVDFEGRDPVLFISSTGAAINNIDVTTALRPVALPQFSILQRTDGSLLVRLRDLTMSGDTAVALRGVFGAAQPIDFEAIEADEWKVVPYRREP